MPSRASITTDHEQIRRWTEQRGGHPAAVKRTRDKDNPGILRIDFPGYSGAQSLAQISWEEFFEKFDEQNLAFLYQETTARGLRSNFNKLIKRRAAEKNQTRSGRSTGRSSAGRDTQATVPARARKSGGAPSRTKGGRDTGRPGKTR